MKKIFYLIVPFLLLWFAIATWRSLAPANTLRRLENVASTNNPRLQDTTLNHPKFRGLYRELEYKKSLKQLKRDSINLLVNLADSTVGLFINGVTIHRVKATDIFIDPVLNLISNTAYVNLFAAPIRIAGDTATIVKEPIVVREAPKDTIEAALNAYKPDTLIQNPAFWLVKLPANIDMIFSQSEDQTDLDREIRSRFFRWLNELDEGKKLSRMFSFKAAETRVRIEIGLPVEDLRAIYRALPTNGYVLIRL